MAGEREPIKALVVGGVSWNTMVHLDTFPEPVPHTVFARGAHESVGSSGAGKALNLAYLGTDVTLWGMVGEDELGARIRDALAARGVRFLAATDPAGTMRHVNLMDGSGDRISIFTNTHRPDAGIDVDAVSVEAGPAELVAVTILDHCRAFLPMLEAMGKPVWIDIHDYDGADPHHAEFIEAADCLFMSSSAMPGWRAFLEGRVVAGTTVAVCTHGAAGASGLTASEGWIDVPVVEVPAIVDTNGAGDAFFAGFAAAWLGDAGLAAALHLGAELAAAAIQSPELAPIGR